MNEGEKTNTPQKEDTQEQETKKCTRCLVEEREGINNITKNDMQQNKTDFKLHLIDWQDQPFSLCEECLQTQIKEEDEQTQLFEKEISSIQGKLEQTEQRIAEIQLKILSKDKEFHDDEKTLKANQENEILQKQEEQINKQTQALKEKVLSFEVHESTYWNDVNVFEKRLQTLLTKRAIACNLETLYNEKLAKLNKYNTLNSVFKIEVSEQVGLINNLMLGKKLNEDVTNSNSLSFYSEIPLINWDETNAALGQVVLLFGYLINKFGYEKRLIKDIDACSNESSICEKEKKEEFFLKGPFNTKTDEPRFNKGMKLLLSEFQLFSEFLSITEFKNILVLPFLIHPSEGTIDGIQLSTQPTNNPPFKGLDNWTQAFKKLLINFKYLIRLNALYDTQKEIEILEKE